MIHEYLATGASNARTCAALKEVLGLKRREVTRQIEKERRQGWPICASVTHPRGYFLAATQEELNVYCRRLGHRCMEVEKTLMALEAIEGLPSECQ